MEAGEWGYMSAAAGAVESLRRAGVTRVFGIPAVASSDLFSAFAGSRIEVIVTTGEQSAAHMADAHSRVTGELSVCLVGPGAGLTGSLGGITAARLDSSPLIVLVSSYGMIDRQLYASRLQMLDPLIGSRPLCKGAFSVDQPEEVPSVFSQAVQLARGGEPGPVLIEMPAEVQNRSCRMEGTGFRQGPRVLAKTAVRELERVVDALAGECPIGLYAGAGCFEAIDELTELARRLGAPVACSISGLGVLPAQNPLFTGFGPGPAGAPLTQSAFSRCRMVLALGCKFCEVETEAGKSEPGKVVHIDLEPARLVRDERIVTIQAPVKQALRFILDRLKQGKDSDMHELLLQGKRELKQAFSRRADWEDAVDPVKFFIVLRELLGAEDRLILDAGRHAYFGIACYPVQSPRTLVVPVGYRALGFAVPAAIATSLARPDLRVVACVGDGGFLLGGTELLTARRCNVAPVVVVFSEAPPDSLVSSGSRLLDRETLFGLVPVNYELFARALDVGYVRIMKDADLQDGLKRALTMDAPVVVELRVAYREADAYLKGARRKTWQRLPRPLSLRLGAQYIMHRILEGT